MQDVFGRRGARCALNSGGWDDSPAVCDKRIDLCPTRPFFAAFEFFKNREEGTCVRLSRKGRDGGCALNSGGWDDDVSVCSNDDAYVPPALSFQVLSFEIWKEGTIMKLSRKRRAA